MITIEKLDEKIFASMRKDWNDFISKSTNNNIFLTWEWLWCWWQAFAKEDMHFYFLIARNDDNDAIVAIFPFQLVKRRFKRVIPMRVLMTIGRGGGIISNEVEYNTFMMPPTLPEFELPAIETLIHYLESHKSDWDILYFGDLIASHKTTGVIYDGFGKKYDTDRKYQEDNHVVILPETFGSYFKKLTKKERNRYRRVEKKIRQKQEANYFIPAVEEEMVDFLNEYYYIIKKRHDWTPSEEKEKFLDLICNHFIKRGWLKSYILRIEETPAATALGFLYNGKYYGYKAGFNPLFHADSPGKCLFLKIVKDAIQEGMDEVDMLTGNYSYKKNWSNDIRRIENITIYNNSKVSKFRILLNRCLDELKRQMFVSTHCKGHFLS
jgi:lipid II:glycine glycyltransferase (peptidoglycan interpeptide bridge formation enzyme)